MRNSKSKNKEYVAQFVLRLKDFEVNWQYAPSTGAWTAHWGRLHLERERSMITVRQSNQRGHADHGWLKSYHTFSFADYHDEHHMGFSKLRVINEDRISPAQGFSTHPHKDMEIISYVVSGALEHRDSMGNSTVIKPGEVQRMSAGRGIRHSEMNHSKTEETHFLQIWILPEKEGLAPSYGQKDFSNELKSGDLVLTVARENEEGAITVNQDIKLFVGKLNAQKKIILPLSSGRNGWAQLISGTILVNGMLLQGGDGAQIQSESNPTLETKTDAHFLFFDLP